MLLTVIRYTYKGESKTLTLDLNNPDHQDKITRTILWATHNSVTLTFDPLPLSVVKEAKVG